VLVSKMRAEHLLLLSARAADTVRAWARRSSGPVTISGLA